MGVNSSPKFAPPFGKIKRLEAPKNGGLVKRWLPAFHWVFVWIETSPPNKRICLGHFCLEGGVKIWFDMCLFFKTKSESIIVQWHEIFRLMFEAQNIHPTGPNRKSWHPVVTKWFPWKHQMFVMCFAEGVEYVRWAELWEMQWILVILVLIPWLFVCTCSRWFHIFD